jgi:hypothetical protein
VYLFEWLDKLHLPENASLRFRSGFGNFGVDLLQTGLRDAGQGADARGRTAARSDADNWSSLF